MLLVQKSEYEWPSRSGRVQAEHPVTKLEGDRDVFGDGSVMIVATPATRRDIQSLLVKLPRPARCCSRRCRALQKQLGQPRRSRRELQQGADVASSSAWPT
jgi:hypothetical protein